MSERTRDTDTRETCGLYPDATRCGQPRVGTVTVAGTAIPLCEEHFANDHHTPGRARTLQRDVQRVPVPQEADDG